MVVGKIISRVTVSTVASVGYRVNDKAVVCPSTTGWVWVSAPNNSIAMG
jgi:hypothetical protein